MIIPKKCSVAECNNGGKITRGYCPKHYARLRKWGDVNFVKRHRDGRKKHPLYHTYMSMHKRCENKNYRRYKNYGGRGISVCARWTGIDGFTNFTSDMGEKPTPKHTLDRIDNNGNYEPSNCRWATYKEQAANTRRKPAIHGSISMYMGHKCRCNECREATREYTRKSRLRKINLVM